MHSRAILSHRFALHLLGLSLSLWSCPPADARPLVLDERMAAFHQTIVAVRESSPVACLQTYVKDRQTWTESYGLAKLVVGTRSRGQTTWASSVGNPSVRDVPGGVHFAYRCGPTRVDCEWRALPVGRSAGTWAGAALLTVSAPGTESVLVKVGGSRLLDFPRPRSAWLAEPGLCGPGDKARLERGVGILTSREHPLVVAVAGQGLRSETAQGGSFVFSEASGGRAALLVAFAPYTGQATKLASADLERARREANAYYSGLLGARVETPEPVIDVAFRNAILTLDYNWVAPYGWNECIHHWMSMWHMQHSPAEELLGHPDRSRASLDSHITRLMPSGAAPQLAAGGFAHRDFGGSNQFIAWQMRHYWEQTGDRSVLAEFARALDRIIDQTWAENDPDGNGLLGWGQQIGNQEDYVSSPHDATTPTIEGLQMLDTRRLFAKALGDRATVVSLTSRIQALESALKDRLWLPELGRFAYFRPAVGSVRYEGQYHTYLYPAIYGIGTAMEQWMGLRHFRDRLVGGDGAAYVSNGFPWHAGGTWGMQAGVAQQPWAARGLAAVGETEEAYQPLRAAARWVMDLNHRGSWPEIATEATPAYFSPPAGLYLQAVVETLFGLTRSVPSGVLSVAPCFPRTWKAACLTLPGIRARYVADDHIVTYDVWSDRPLVQRLSINIPDGRVIAVHANGRPVRWSIRPCINCSRLSATAARSSHVVWRIVTRHQTVAVRYAPAVGEGEWFKLVGVGARLAGLTDPCCVASGWRRQADGSVSVRLRSGIVAPWRGYGSIGVANFARRSLFAELVAADGKRHVRSVDITVLPRYESMAGPLAVGAGGASFILTLRNNRSVQTSGIAVVQVGQVSYRVDAGARARSERRVSVPVRRADVALLSPGDNSGSVAWPDGSRSTFVLDAAQAFGSVPALADWARGRLEAVPLPETRLREDTSFRDWRRFLAAGHMPWAATGPPLETLRRGGELAVPDLPGLFRSGGVGRAVPVSRQLGSPTLSVPIHGPAVRKVYLALLGMLDNHDTFSRIGSVSCRLRDGTIIGKDLRFPGDLDWFWPVSSVGAFATSRPRPGRLSLAPLLPVGCTDYGWARPPLYPDPTAWSSSRCVELGSANISVVEVDLHSPVLITEVSVQVEDPEAALAVVGITVERATGHGNLSDGPWAPDPRHREPQLLFAVTSPGGIDGWEVGPAFSVSSEPRLFSAPTLNSLVRQGEPGVGEARSPEFRIEAPRLCTLLQGGRHSAGAALELRVVACDDGAVLASVQPAGTHMLQDVVIDVTSYIGRRARLVLVDANPGASYAWIGMGDVWMSWQ